MASRIQVSSAASGSPVNFTFSSNPNEYLAEDSPPTSTFEVLHGANITHKNSFDSRSRSLIWRGNLVGSEFIDPIVVYFRSIEGEIRYFNFLDLNSINLRWPGSDTWRKARILGILAQYRKGGRLQFDSLTLKIAPEE